MVEYVVRWFYSNPFTWTINFIKFECRQVEWREWNKTFKNQKMRSQSEIEWMRITMTWVCCHSHFHEHETHKMRKNNESASDQSTIHAPLDPINRLGTPNDGSNHGPRIGSSTHPTQTIALDWTNPKMFSWKKFKINYYYILLNDQNFTFWSAEPFPSNELRICEYMV